MMMMAIHSNDCLLSTKDPDIPQPTVEDEEDEPADIGEYSSLYDLPPPDLPPPPPPLAIVEDQALSSAAAVLATDPSTPPVTHAPTPTPAPVAPSLQALLNQPRKARSSVGVISATALPQPNQVSANIKDDLLSILTSRIAEIRSRTADSSSGDEGKLEDDYDFD